MRARAADPRLPILRVLDAACLSVRVGHGDDGLQLFPLLVRHWLAVAHVHGEQRGPLGRGICVRSGARAREDVFGVKQKQ